MNNQFILLAGIRNDYLFICTSNETGISDLTTTFSVKRRLVENQLIQVLVLLSDLPILHDPHFGFGMIITNEFRLRIFTHRYPVTGFFGGIGFGTTFLFF